MRTDTASRMIAAPAGRLYDALVDAEALAEWLPPTGMTGRVEMFEPRPGGRFRIALRYDSATAKGKTEGNVDLVEGRFVALDPGKRVDWETRFVSDDPDLAGTMRMTWTFVPVEGGARVDIRCEGVPEKIARADHDAGLAASLANLAAFVAG